MIDLQIGDFNNDFMVNNFIDGDIHGDVSSINLSSKNITDNDLIKISNMTKIQYLDLNNNHITDITPLSNMLDMKKLDLKNNYITDITPLLNFRYLFHLQISIDNVTNLLQLQQIIYNNIEWLDVLYIYCDKEFTEEQINILQILDCCRRQITLHIINKKCLNFEKLFNINMGKGRLLLSMLPYIYKHNPNNELVQSIPLKEFDDDLADRLFTSLDIESPNISTIHSDTPYYEYVKATRKIIEFVWLEYYRSYGKDTDHDKMLAERIIKRKQEYKQIFLKNSN
jgi:hypothetical protein